MYVAVKGGAAAIENSWQLLAAERRGDPTVSELTATQIKEQLRLAVDRVMTEGSLYDPELAALAIKQAQGDLIEAIFLLRAYRTTLPRFGYAVPLDTAQMALSRRISATFKDVPGGQVLGATYDYTQRLLDFALLAEGEAAPRPSVAAPLPASMPRVGTLMAREGPMETPQPAATDQPGDLTRAPLLFPADRAARLQGLARGDEGFVLALGYSTQRGYANGHPFAGEIRRGWAAVEFVPDELGFALELGDVEVTECQMVNQFAGSRAVAPQFTQGYGLAFGAAERKSIAMALVDRALRAEELDETRTAPAQDQEFVLMHADNVEASGFVQHLKLPHYVDFQSELELVRRLRAERAAAAGTEQEAA
ncbi:MAG TPA: carbon-phosphorus lyase complex subunit PhnI [Burkholderiaceae bacterium]|nr:carbon-phosphorus lyase complex subunit PhnI [Burkholderiaceae bacterium]